MGGKRTGTWRRISNGAGPIRYEISCGPRGPFVPLMMIRDESKAICNHWRRSTMSREHLRWKWADSIITRVIKEDLRHVRRLKPRCDNSGSYWEVISLPLPQSLGRLSRIAEGFHVYAVTSLAVEKMKRVRRAYDHWKGLATTKGGCGWDDTIVDSTASKRSWKWWDFGFGCGGTWGHYKH